MEERVCKLVCLEARSRTVWWVERVQAEVQGWEGGWERDGLAVVPDHD